MVQYGTYSIVCEESFQNGFLAFACEGKKRYMTTVSPIAAREV